MLLPPNILAEIVPRNLAFDSSSKLLPRKRAQSIKDAEASSALIKGRGCAAPQREVDRSALLQAPPHPKRSPSRGWPRLHARQEVAGADEG